MEDGIYDVIIVCLHHRIAQPCIKQALPFLKKGSILMDMCGLKGQMVLEFTNACRMAGLYYVGTHPMAGREKSGYYASIPNLFDGANFIITPTYGTSNEAVERVSALAKEIGLELIHRGDSCCKLMKRITSERTAPVEAPKKGGRKKKENDGNEKTGKAEENSAS